GWPSSQRRKCGQGAVPACPTSTTALAGLPERPGGGSSRASKLKPPRGMRPYPARPAAMSARRLSSSLMTATPASLFVRVGEGAPPDFLVDDVGHFSPACFGLLSTEGVGHRLLLPGDEVLEAVVDARI